MDHLSDTIKQPAQPKPWEVPRDVVVAAFVPCDGSDVSAVAIPVNPNIREIEIQRILGGKASFTFFRTRSRKPKTLHAAAILRDEDFTGESPEIKYVDNPKIPGIKGHAILFERIFKYEEMKNISLYTMNDLNRCGALPFPLLEDSGMFDAAQQREFQQAWIHRRGLQQQQQQQQALAPPHDEDDDIHASTSFIFPLLDQIPTTD
jgi:hypothetical protein